MKVIFTEDEVKDILISHVRRVWGERMDQVQINSYMGDFVVITQSAALKEELANPKIDSPL